MSVKCGRGHYHDSIDEVRACYGVDSAGLPRPEFRTNKYGGSCRLCGNKVEAEQGRVDKIDDKWEVSHLEGKCGPKTSKLKIEHTTQYADIAQGHYATKSLSGNNDFDFWRVDRPTEGQWAGKAFVKRIVGGKPEMSVTRTMKFAVLEQILSEGADVCAKRYADELGRCSRCNRLLTDETSRAFGQGPECRSKGR